MKKLKDSQVSASLPMFFGAQLWNTKTAIRDMALPEAQMSNFILNQSQDFKNYSNSETRCWKLF